MAKLRPMKRANAICKSHSWDVACHCRMPFEHPEYNPCYYFFAQDGSVKMVSVVNSSSGKNADVSICAGTL